MPQRSKFSNLKGGVVARFGLGNFPDKSAGRVWSLSRLLQDRFKGLSGSRAGVKEKSVDSTSPVNTAGELFLACYLSY